jgi:hypothetical protein
VIVSIYLLENTFVPNTTIAAATGGGTVSTRSDLSQGIAASTPLETAQLPPHLSHSTITKSTKIKKKNTVIRLN